MRRTRADRYRGSCHCGAIKFEIRTDLSRIVECNCSICTKKGAVHHRVPAEDFMLVAGEDALALYQFGSKAAKHHFCKHCGIHPFSRPRAAPEAYSVNVRCLDGYPAVVANATVVNFDGRNWEDAVRDFQFK